MLNSGLMFGAPSVNTHDACGVMLRVTYRREGNHVFQTRRPLTAGLHGGNNRMSKPESTTKALPTSISQEGTHRTARGHDPRLEQLLHVVYA